ncbi:AraC family transcriptional regulator [Ideonella sp. 4Y16]|uniref:AraC family transcriptional regulator n=1 Tax=Ideonella alba TaxID=2824118 RepID=UPI001B3947C5|nr:AraC family transcriptional regulator [Ideonella alba]MBQ0945432.1 AraC family transcriptional regulator [Ideonella alba]
MTQLTRSAGLSGFSDLVSGYGLDPVELAAQARLPAQALTQPDLLVAASSVATLLDLAAARTGVEDFGLRLADKRRMSNMGPMALLAGMQPSLRQMLAVVCHYQSLNIGPLSLLVEEEGDVAVLRGNIDLADRVGSRQVSELIFGGLCRYIQAVMQTGWRPRSVMFRHLPPRGPTMHRDLFRCSPAFRADFDGLVLARSDLDVAFDAPDPVLLSYLQDHIDQLIRGRARSISEEVGEVIVALLPTGQCNADAVAAHLGMTRRTLHRRLADASTSFRQLMEDKRLILVTTYLGGHRKHSEIAELVGLNSASGLSHWMRRHSVTPPPRTRRRLR